MSSAHVYLRLPPGMTWDTIPEPLLQDLAQLTKANSIEGNKKNDITVIYTPWSNLKKQAGMETGQVSFFKGQTVKRVHVAKRENSIINRLEKTRVELSPDFAAEKIAWEKEVRLEKREQEKMRVNLCVWGVAGCWDVRIPVLWAESCAIPTALSLKQNLLTTCSQWSFSALSPPFFFVKHSHPFPPTLRNKLKCLKLKRSARQLENDHMIIFSRKRIWSQTRNWWMMTSPMIGHG